MACSLESLAADDFDRGMPEVKETVIRRIGGRDDRTEDVEAIVEIDDGQGMVVNSGSQLIEVGGRLEVAASQETTFRDTWVIRGEVYHQIGEPVSKDAASQTVILTRRKSITAREPRVRR